MKKNKKIWTISLFISMILMIILLVRIFSDTTENKQILSQATTTGKYFAIIPHFTIQPWKIDSFYSFLQTTYQIDTTQPLNIVVISPDHFNATTNTITMACKDTKKLCYKDRCIPAKTLKQTDEPWCIPSQTKEHGLGEQIKFIQKIFPQGKIYPIILKPRKFGGDDSLIQMLDSYKFVGKTLYIASVDFSHYVAEDFALLHDKKTFYTLNNATSIQEYTSLEVDCPSCLYVVNSLAKKNNVSPQLFLRDSSSTITHKDLGTENTSRQFIYYTAQQNPANGFTIAFFGDLIFDREVARTLSTGKRINEYFQTFFQQENIQLWWANYIHRKLRWIDFVGFNLETPIVENPETCISSHKEVSFCSSNQIISYLTDLGFTMANIANNHSFDGWIPAHEETIQQLQKYGLQYFWYEKDGKYFEKNYTVKTTVRGIKIARLGFDFTITPTSLFPTYCKLLQTNDAEWYINVVSAHRWTEYQSTHNALQESLWKQLIDCGADIIIGHHPHVIQDIWRYKNKPIIYSLGNFLFDQKDPVATKKGEYVLIDYQSSGTINLETWTINSSIYK